MPADEDYGRRHSILQHASATNAPPVAGDRYQTSSPADHHRFAQDRPSSCPSDKNGVQSVSVPDRLEPPERFQSSVPERFTSERSNSDRLPSGERYHCASERYPLGDKLQTAVSSDRLSQAAGLVHSQTFQADRHSDRRQSYSDRFATVQNVGSLERYHTHATLDR